MIFVVLGMHKSGTTLISQILHTSGIDMGTFNPAQTYDQGNQYERRETLELNLDILGCSHADHSLDVITPVADSSGGEMKWDRKMEEIIRANDDRFQNWGFKDPRTCLTYSLWKKQITEHKLIVVFRNPLELWYHYTRKSPWYRSWRKLRYGIKALKAWYVYNQEILRHLEAGTSPAGTITLEFSDFMTSEKPLEKLRAFTGVELRDHRRKDLYRSKGNPSLTYRLCTTALSLFQGMKVDELYSRLQAHR